MIVRHVVRLFFDHFLWSLCYLHIILHTPNITPELWCSHGKPSLPCPLETPPLCRLCSGWWRHFRNSSLGLCVWLWMHYQICFMQSGPMNIISAWRRGGWIMQASWSNSLCQWFVSSCTSSYPPQWSICLHTFGTRRIIFCRCCWWGPPTNLYNFWFFSR